MGPDERWSHENQVLLVSECITDRDRPLPVSRLTLLDCTNGIGIGQLESEGWLDGRHGLWYHVADSSLTTRGEKGSMSEIITHCVYFAEPGPANTARTLDLVATCAEALGLRRILVASTTGATGVQAARTLANLEVIVVSHSAGFKGPNTQELTAENRAAVEAAGGRILTCQHAFGGVGRAVRKKLGTYELEEIIAYTLRTFGEGMKVAAEIALMAADAGLVPVGDPVIAVAGTGHGADTAVVLRPANAQTFFDLRFVELICMPSPGHP